MYEVAAEAVDAGVDLVQLYQLDGGHGMIPTPAEQEIYFRELLDRIRYPVAISVHAYAGYMAPISLLTTLSRDYEQLQTLNLMGVPNSYFMAVRDALPSSVRLYCGVTNLVHMLTLGASGALLAENNVIPMVCRRIADHWRDRDLDALGEATRTVQRFSSIVTQWAPSTARWAKMALKVLELPGGNGVLRRPYLLPPEDDQRRMGEAFSVLGIQEIEGLKVSALT
jgi:dihydrodipicolinate synthase/N-acetylneuraminate lyase